MVHLRDLMVQLDETRCQLSASNSDKAVFDNGADGRLARRQQ